MSQNNIIMEHSYNSKTKEQSLIVTNQSLQIGSIKTSSNDLFVRIKGLLVLGKVIGVIPCEGVFQSDFRKFKYRRWSIGSFVSVCIAIAIGVNCIVSFVRMCRAEKKNAIQLARSGSGVAYFSYAVFAHCYFLKKADEFSKLFSKWANLQLYTVIHDKTLSRDAGIITGFIFTSAVLENLVLQFTKFSIEFETSNDTDTTLRNYYHKAYGGWADLIEYHWFWSISAFTIDKFTLYTWNFIEILIAVFSRSMSSNFRLLNQSVESQLPSVGTGLFSDAEAKTKKINWSHFVRDHSAICTLLDRFERFLSPLIFCTYAIDIYYACLLLLLSLLPSAPGTENKSVLYTVYSAWSFFHLIIRLYIVSIFAADINTQAHRIGRVLRSCPMSCYTKEVERTERKMKTNPQIGLTGLGCFTITKPFILSVIGVVFTFEIVLIQSYPQPNCSIK